MGEEKETVSKDRHPALDAGSPKKAILVIRGAGQARNDESSFWTFETAPFSSVTFSQRVGHSERNGVE